MARPAMTPSQSNTLIRSPGVDRLRFEVLAAIGQDDVEEMELAVASHLVAAAVVDHAGVEVALIAPLDQAATVEKDALFPGLLPRPLGARAGDLLRGGRVGLVGAEVVEHLGEQNEVGALVGELLDALCRRGQVGRLVLPGVHLDEPDLHAAIISRR